MINFSKIFLINEVSRLKKENEKLFSKNIELSNENIELRDKLEDSINDRFELTCKLENINNYIAVLENKLIR